MKTISFLTELNPTQYYELRAVRLVFWTIDKLIVEDGNLIRSFNTHHQGMRQSIHSFNLFFKSIKQCLSVLIKWILLFLIAKTDKLLWNWSEKYRCFLLVFQNRVRQHLNFFLLQNPFSKTALELLFSIGLQNRVLWAIPTLSPMKFSLFWLHNPTNWLLTRPEIARKELLEYTARTV